MIVRGGIPLRWRIAILSSLAVALLSIVAAFIAFAVVRSSLTGDLQRSLREDVVRVAQDYGGVTGAEGNAVEDETAEAAGTQAEDSTLQIPPQGPTGGVVIQLYNAEGTFIAASDDDTQDYTADNLVIPASVVASASEIIDWRGTLTGRPVRAALAPVSFGVVAVVSPSTYIGTALNQLARALAITGTALILLSSLIGYLVAAAAMRPITQLASLAAQLDPNHLAPIDYQGPKDEVGQLNYVLNDLIVRLRASMDAQRSFLAETSHELRTPLTSLQGFLDRAVRRAPPEVRSDLEDVRRIARTMSRLVADILQLSRGQLVREFVPHLLDPYFDILQPVAEEFPGVRLDAEPESLLLGDPERLRQLIRNLTANAVRATGDPKKVVLSLCQLDHSIVLSVCDSGPGIAPDILPNIFEKFYKGAGGGAGLGLAIARQIAEVHQGDIEVESVYGQGTTFRVTLPTFAETVMDE